MSIQTLKTLPRVMAQFEATPQKGRMLDDKEQRKGYTLLCKTANGWQDAVTVRVWMGRSSGASVVYASVWITGPYGQNFYASGTGQAGGYGYHKLSAAVASAVSSAGAKLYGCPYGSGPEDFTKPFSFGGTGDGAFLDIFAALAKAAGHDVEGSILVDL